MKNKSYMMKTWFISYEKIKSYEKNEILWKNEIVWFFYIVWKKWKKLKDKANVED